MPSASQAIRLGPFRKGINILSDPSALDEEELFDVVNMEVELDGSLFSRPAIESIVKVESPSRPYILGWGRFDQGDYLIGSTNAGLVYFDNNIWSIIPGTAAVENARTMSQVKDKVWVFPRPGKGSNAGVSWSPVAGAEAFATMREAESSVFHKNRIFVIGMSQEDTSLRWSLLDQTGTQPGNFPAGNEIKVSDGDGEVCTGIMVFNDNIIIFKENSIWAFSFESDPVTDGSLRLVSNTVGAYRKDCVIAHENSLYILYQLYVYEMVNYDVTRINMRVPFEYDVSATASWADPLSLSIVGQRIICRYYNRLYVFGLRTRTWTRWDSVYPVGRWWLKPPTSAGGDDITYYSSTATTAYGFYKFVDEYDTVQEPMTCRIVTKNYDFTVSHKFKRLYWWGLDGGAATTVTGFALPISASYGVTWAQLETTKWDDVDTWGFPLANPYVATVVSQPNLGSVRRFYKFLKALRFRQIQFGVSIPTDGSNVQAPVRIFSMTAIVDTNQTVVKGVS